MRVLSGIFVFFICVALGAADRVVLVTTETAPSLRAAALWRGIDDELRKLVIRPEIFSCQLSRSEAKLETLNRILEGERQQIVVALDRDALEFLILHLDHLPARAQLIFCGSDQPVRLPRPLPRPATGIYEACDFSSLIRQGLALFPETQKVFLLTSESERGKALEVQAAAWSRTNAMPELVLLPEREHMPDARKKYVESAPSDALILHEGGGFEIERNSPVGSGLEAVASAPLLVLDKEALGWGALGSYGVDPLFSGQAAGRLTARLLAGERAQAIRPVVLAPRLYLDYRALRRWNVPNSRLPENAILINAPPKWYAISMRHRTLALGGILAGGTLVFLLFLAWRIERSRFVRQRRKLRLFQGFPAPFLLLREDGTLLLDNGFEEDPERRRRLVRAFRRAAPRTAGPLVLRTAREVCRGYLAPYVSPDGELRLWWFQDAPAEAALEDTSPARCREVLNAIPGGVLLTDGAGAVVFANRGAAVFLACAPEEAPGRALKDVLKVTHALTGESYPHLFDAALRHGLAPGNEHLVAHPANGCPVPIRLHIQPFFEAEGMPLWSLVHMEDCSPERDLRTDLVRAESAKSARSSQN